ncbi:MAG: VWA domain-containing protein, partial [Candidatus Methanoperedens sp.]|nr:VWA domain-containing protein [Candidatus Methanoperedens sp.]
ADVLPRQEAKEKFEQAASQGKSAGLLETRKQNLFSYSLSFAPRQSIVVRLKYEQAVKKSLGEYEYVLFLRKTDQAHSVNDLSVNLSISSVNNINTLETPGFTGASVKYLSATKGQVKYSAKALPDKDLTVVYTTNNPPLNGDMLFYSTGGHGYMMHVFSPTEADLGTTALSKDIIFVIDKSGSMSGEKIEQVKRVFTSIISDLPPDDFFNVIFFDASTRAFSSTLMEANAKNKADAANFVNSLDASSGTNINQALLDALAMFGKSSRVPIIVFLTDGAPTEGITSPYVIRKNVGDANKLKVSIFTIAFGIEDEGNYDFLKALSLENYGKAQRFYPESGVEEEMKGFYKTISTPLITDMSFTYNAVSDIVNTGQNNLFAGSDAIVLGKYSLGAGTIISEVAATTRAGNRNFKNSFAVVPKPENAFIPRLWAYTRIRNLMDRIDVEGETETLKSSITKLSLEFKFVTPYTSLFVEVPMNKTRTTATSIDAKAEAAIKAVPAVNATAAIAAVTPAVTPTPAAATVAPAAAETAKPPAATSTPKEPGFEVIVAIIGLLSIKYLMLCKRR